MQVQSQIGISSSVEQVWKVVSDIEIASEVFKDIKKTTILEKPESGLIGLKWEEVRDFMGKEATETMWITEAIENSSYTSEARNSGCLYHSSLFIEDCDGELIVTKTFRSTPESFFAKMMSPVMSLMKGTLKKCLNSDLEDLKSYLEGHT